MHKFTNMIREDWIYTFISAIQIFFRKSVINRGIRLYNKAPDYIKELEKDKAFKRELRSLLLQHAFYSVDEYMSF
jgi:hypothetical protein